jgi:dihydrolipoamide dehydrogenase
MAANDGPVPVRTLAHAARMISQAPQLGQYGIAVGEPVLDYPRLLARVREVVDDVLAHSSLREQIDSAGVTVHEKAGRALCRPPHRRHRGRAARLTRSSSALAASAEGCPSPAST